MVRLLVDPREMPLVRQSRSILVETWCLGDLDLRQNDRLAFLDDCLLVVDVILL